MRKKYAGLIICFAIILICTIAFVGCNSTDKINKFGDKLSKSNNCEVNLIMEVPVFGTVEMKMKVDGNKSYTSEYMGEPAEFTETIDGIIYTYTKSGSKWQKDSGVAKTEDNTPMGESEEFLSLFNGENYEYSKDKKGYVLKDNASVDFMGMTSILMVIDGNDCTITGVVPDEEATMKVTIKIINVGKTTVELPTV